MYSSKDVAQIVGVQESRVRYWAQTGFVGPSEKKNGRAVYSFQDLVGVKTAKELLVINGKHAICVLVNDVTERVLAEKKIEHDDNSQYNKNYRSPRVPKRNASCKNSHRQQGCEPEQSA